MSSSKKVTIGVHYIKKNSCWIQVLPRLVWVSFYDNDLCLVQFNRRVTTSLNYVVGVDTAEAPGKL
jgi:hypothetical protein